MQKKIEHQGCKINLILQQSIIIKIRVRQSACFSGSGEYNQINHIDLKHEASQGSNDVGWVQKKIP